MLKKFDRKSITSLSLLFTLILLIHTVFCTYADLYRIISAYGQAK